MIWFLFVIASVTFVIDSVMFVIGLVIFVIDLIIFLLASVIFILASDMFVLASIMFVFASVTLVLASVIIFYEKFIFLEPGKTVMKYISKEEMAKLPLRGRGNSSKVFREIINMEKGQILEIEPADWGARTYPPTQIVKYIAKKYKRKYNALRHAGAKGSSTRRFSRPFAGTLRKSEIPERRVPEMGRGCEDTTSNRLQ